MVFLQQQQNVFISQWLFNIYLFQLHTSSKCLTEVGNLKIAQFIIDTSLDLPFRFFLDLFFLFASTLKKGMHEDRKFYLRKHNEERVRNSSCSAHDINVFFSLSFVYFSPYSPLSKTAYTPLTFFIRYCWYVSDLWYLKKISKDFVWGW